VKRRARLNPGRNLMMEASWVGMDFSTLGHFNIVEVMWTNNSRQEKCGGARRPGGLQPAGTAGSTPDSLQPAGLPRRSSAKAGTAGSTFSACWRQSPARRRGDANAGSLLLVGSEAYVHAQKRAGSVPQAAAARKPPRSRARENRGRHSPGCPWPDRLPDVFPEIASVMGSAITAAGSIFPDGAISDVTRDNLRSKYSHAGRQRGL
jgi:hypothetical protein